MLLSAVLVYPDLRRLCNINSNSMCADSKN